jgi:hypothetical protein
MKIKVERTKNSIVKLQFNAGGKYISGNNPYLMESEIQNLVNNQYGCACDFNYTLRTMGDGIILFYGKECTVELKINTRKFFAACLQIPIEKEIIMDSNSFNKQKVIDNPDAKSWVEIGKWIQPDCKKIILNAKKRGLHTELKPILSRYVGKAQIYPDHDRLNLSFYFNGRYEGGCGYNGGIICHNAGEETFSVELTSKPGAHYSVHT